MIVLDVIIGIGSGMVLFNIAYYDAKDISAYFGVGLAIALSTDKINAMVSIIYLSKIVNQHIRGTMFSAMGMFGNVALLILQGLGGYLYSDVSKLWPFIIAFGLHIA